MRSLLSWPCGLDTLLGHFVSSTPQSLQQQKHPAHIHATSLKGGLEKELGCANSKPLHAFTQLHFQLEISPWAASTPKADETCMG